MQLAPHIRVRPEKFGAILFDPVREKFFVVNELGKDVLEFMKGAASVEGIVSELGRVYEESSDVMRRDIHAFVDELKLAGLLAE